MMKTYNTGPCAVCKKRISNAGFAYAAHRRMHVARGELLEVSRFSWKGIVLETRTILPTEVTTYEQQQFFTSFERCVEAYQQKHGPLTNEGYSFLTGDSR